MTTSPLAESGRHAVYTGRATNWPMVLATVIGAALLASMAACGPPLVRTDSPFIVSYGFWWTPTRTNCTTRSGRTVTVTVPDPPSAVAALPNETAYPAR